jgi:putative heme-binding domain-containing protein
LPHQLTLLPGGRIVYSQGVLNNGKVTDAAGHTIDFNKTQVATFRPDGTAHEVIGAGLNNIWCWSMSREGRVFIHEANDLGYSLVPFEEDSTYPSFIATKLHPAAPMHPPTAQGLDLGGTGFSGLALCDDRSGSFPAPWQGLMFVSNPILGRIQAVSMAQGDNGVFTFKKAGDLVKCSDPMFRPVAITFGPDGCLYITDWYNRIISHNEVARDHPGRDKSRGRIWRVRHHSQKPRAIPNLTKVPTAELPQHLTADSTWEMRAAWQEIAARKAMELVPALTQQVRAPGTPDDVRIHTVWALEDLGKFDVALWKELLASGNANVRREAVRAMSSLKVAPVDAFTLFQPLAAETAWTVRYEILRYFRRLGAAPEHLAWLHQWSVGPAPQAKVDGWNGPFLALGGAYERAFQDFLILRITDKSDAGPANDPRWDTVLETKSARAATETAAINERIAAVTKAIATAGNRPLDEGRTLVTNTCLLCHRIGDQGVALAPPLDGSANRDTAALITSLVDPDAAVENVFRLYRVESKDGQQFAGFRKNVDTKELTLVNMGGGQQVIPLNTITKAGYVQGQSVMPALGVGLTVEQTADVVRYLKTVK